MYPNTIVEANPITFIQQIAEMIQDGKYVQNTINGSPIMGFPMSITLFEVEKPEVINPLPDDIHTVVLEGWDMMQYLLDMQNLILQGFDIDMNKVVYGDFKSIVFKRAEKKAEPVKVDLTPAPRKTRAKKGEQE